MNPRFNSMFSTVYVNRSVSFRPLQVLALFVLAFSMSGCSTISDSISDSVSAPFKWSSKSSESSSEDSKDAYQGDIKHYTEVYTRSNSEVAGFTKGLSSISKQHGISNWEADHSTYIGVGEGLAKAKVPHRQVDVFITYLSQGDPQKIAAIQKGYEQRR